MPNFTYLKLDIKFPVPPPNLPRKHSEFLITFEDFPYYFSHWKQVKGLFPPSDEDIINSVQALKHNEVPDFELRFSFPLNLSSPKKAKTTVLLLATAEHQVTPDMLTSGSPNWSQTKVLMMIPSKWSMALFRDHGQVPDDKMILVPHGVDTAVYYPEPNGKRSENCLNWWAEANVPESSFVFLHVSGAYPNKNIPMLIEAFNNVRQDYPHAVLVLKVR